jgi:hypothetical protein
VFLALEPPKFRKAKIRCWLDKEPSIALLVSAAHFEWTVHRALLLLCILLSNRTNREIRLDLEKVYGLERYKDFWRDGLRHLPQARSIPQIVSDWKAVTDAFDARNRLIHGRGRYTRNMASPHVEYLLRSAAEVRDCCSRCGANFGARLPVRKKSHSA